MTTSGSRRDPRRELARALRVYVVTPAGGDHLGVARAAVGGGAGCVQLRAPELDSTRRREVAAELVEVCRAAGTLAIIDDDLEVALEVAAAGGHLGQGDRARVGGSWAEIRRRAGALLLGASVDDVEQAHEAADAGVDYLGVTVFSTSTKADAVPRGLDTLAAIADASQLPVVAIGGLRAGNVRAVLDAGADGVAVISAVSGARDPVAAVAELVAVAAGG